MNKSYALMPDGSWRFLEVSRKRLPLRRFHMPMPPLVRIHKPKCVCVILFVYLVNSCRIPTKQGNVFHNNKRVHFKRKRARRKLTIEKCKVKGKRVINLRRRLNDSSLDDVEAHLAGICGLQLNLNAVQLSLEPIL